MNRVNTDIFSSIRLEQIENAKLMNRTDTKFCININKLPQLLEYLSDNYYALEIEDKKQLEYSTTYYDTSSNEMIYNHLRGKMNRYKVRKRTYLNSNTSFLEIKFKTNKGSTIKNRILYHGNSDSLSKEQQKFIEQYTPYCAEKLMPVLKNNFKRITLVSKNLDERCTIDFDLSFSQNGKKEQLRSIAIVEVKTQRRNKNSSMLKKMRELHITPTGFSKYCIGRSMIDKSIKRNNLKPKLRCINKLSNNYIVI